MNDLEQAAGFAQTSPISAENINMLVEDSLYRIFCKIIDFSFRKQ
jgi:hypothetical protein